MIVEKVINILNQNRIVFVSTENKKIRNKETKEEFIAAFKGNDTIDKYEEIE